MVTDTRDLSALEKDPFQYDYDSSTHVMTPGGALPLQINFTIPPGHYLYQNKMGLELIPEPGFTMTPLKLSPAKHKQDPITGADEDIYQESATLDATIHAAAMVAPGDHLLKVKLSYQGCSSELCFRFMQQDLLVPVNVPGSVGAETGGADAMALPVGKGFGSALILSFLAGVATDFTPCVLPIIPITLAFIGVRKEGKRRRNFMLTATFIIAMALVYAVMGLAAASLGKSLGFLFQNSLFLIFTIALYLFFSLSLFGLYEIQVPLGLRNAMAKMGGEGYFGSILAGITTGFLAAPCVGPLIGSLLVYVAQSHDLARGFILLFSFGLGMGSLFLVVGTFSQIFANRVRGGAFTLWIKRILALMLLFPAGNYALALYQQWRPQSVSEQGPKAAFWMDDEVAAFAQAGREHKKVLIDFYATWCIPCMEMEHKTFSLPEVQQSILASYVPLRINCSQDTPQCQKMVEKYEVIGWPTLIVTDADGKLLLKSVGKNFLPDEIIDYLKDP